MKIIEATFEKLPTRCLVIGFEGENQRATVRIDCASVFAEYPNATPTLIVKPLFADAYPVVVDRNGTDVDWLITSEILSFTGDGEIQLVFYKDEVICKSAIAKIRVCRSLQVTGDMPDPVAQWIENANRKLAEVDAQIVELEGMVDTATDAATRAEQSASTASAKAEQAAGSAATATEKATEATNAAGTATAKAAEAALSATQASNSAMSAADSERGATAKAGEATTAAGTATAKAEQATEAAQTATGKAGEASASATAARTSETNAAQSAQNAQSSQTAARASETAASTSATQAAQSAQGASSDAQTATQKAAEATQSATDAETFAGTATTKAEEAAASAQAASDAKTAVEQTAEQLADSLEQIAQNTQDIADHEQYAEATYATKTDLYKKADIIHNTASGSIASFPDGADGHPVDEVKVSIEPVQDLHGYDHPWPAGGGKNKVDNSTNVVGGYYGATGSWNGDNNVATTALIPVKANTRYTSSLFTASGAYLAGCVVTLWDDENTCTEQTTTQTFTTGENTQFVRVRNFQAQGTYIVGNDYKFQLEEGGSYTSFAPYSNICPITGWDGVKVTRTGKNLLNLDADGISRNAYNITKIPNYLKPSTTYTFSINGTTTYTWGLYLSNGGDLAKVLVGQKSAGSSATFTTPANMPQPYLVLTGGSSGAGTETVEVIKPQVELGSSSSAYEPYAGNTYSITLPSEAGTVYGGELTVNADGFGSLVVDRAEVDLGNLTWAYGSSSDVSLFYAQIPGKENTNDNSGKCSIYPISQYNAGSISNARTILSGTDKAGCLSTGTNKPYFYVRDDSYINETAFKPSVSGQQLVYELATPITYTLTASEVTTLLGTNNIWADTGDVSVKYNADTKLYIDNKITQAIAAALNA